MSAFAGPKQGVPLGVKVAGKSCTGGYLTSASISACAGISPCRRCSGLCFTTVPVATSHQLWSDFACCLLCSRNLPRPRTCALTWRDRQAVASVNNALLELRRITSPWRCANGLVDTSIRNIGQSQSPNGWVPPWVRRVSRMIGPRFHDPNARSRQSPRAESASGGRKNRSVHGASEPP